MPAMQMLSVILVQPERTFVWWRRQIENFVLTIRKLTRGIQFAQCKGTWNRPTSNRCNWPARTMRRCSELHVRRQLDGSRDGNRNITAAESRQCQFRENSFGLKPELFRRMDRHDGSLSIGAVRFWSRQFYPQENTVEQRRCRN